MLFDRLSYHFVIFECRGGRMLLAMAFVIALRKQGLW
jgi:hypothetical protein